jgi:uncharacterized membrane protein YoaT (DUF817 family)
MPLDPEPQPILADPPTSAAARWAPLGRAIGWEHRLALRMARRRSTAFLYEFLRFGMKQGWACLFGGIMVALMIGTRFFYPGHAPLARYDFLFLAALAVQALLLSFRMETWEEAKIILLYHVIGTIMEIFKTSVGSWIYPEPAFFHIGGVPLFSGFMYAAIGSYLARAWRLFDFRFTHHPPLWALGALSVAIYANFFTHHYVIDLRWGLFAIAAALFGRSWVHYRVWRRYRSMPLLLGLFLVALFIWFAENIGTFTAVWLYPNQHGAWAMVGFSKLGAWFLLLIISYTLVAAVNRPAELR